MSRFTKAVLVVLLVLAVAGVAFGQGAPFMRPAWPAYALSIFFGFGTGHYYVGANGTPFLIGDVGGIAAVGVGYALIASSLISTGLNPSSTNVGSLETGVITGYGLIVVGGIVYAISRIVEDISIFGAVDSAVKAGKVAQIEPVLQLTNTSLEVGLSIRYD